MSVYRTAANQLRTTRILSVETVSPTVKTFTFEDKECAKARPGQFLMLWIPSVDEIPLSILDTHKDAVSVTVKNVGEATKALHCKNIGDTIGIRGPFGNGFKVTGRKLLMVGGGTGVAPLLFLIRRMTARDVRTTFVLGAKTRNELLFLTELRKLRTKKVNLITSTEDGSCGIRGLCTEPVEKLMAKDQFDMMCACGPEQMIFRVFELAERRAINFQASLERLMRCAVGLCGSCAIGKYRVCADGPVFASEQLRQAKGEFGVSKRDQYGRKTPLD